MVIKERTRRKHFMKKVKQIFDYGFPAVTRTVDSNRPN